MLAQTRQHDAAVLGRRPVLVLVDDQGDGVDAIGSEVTLDVEQILKAGQP
ncbi:hypothetical protein [Streptomyces sp. HC307]